MLSEGLPIAAYGGGRSWSGMGSSTVAVSVVEISLAAAGSDIRDKISKVVLFDRTETSYLTDVSRIV